MKVRGDELAVVGDTFAGVIKQAIAAGAARVTVKIEVDGQELLVVGDASGLWINTPRPIANGGRVGTLQ